MSLFCIMTAHSQLSFSGWSNNYMSIDSYQGKTSTDAFVTRFTYSGTNLDITNWRITVSASTPIMSTDGSAEFPVDKIAFIPLNTAGQAQPNPIPTITEIGVPSFIPLNRSNEVYLVPKSNYPLLNKTQYNSYYDLQLHFNLQVLPGMYLKDLQGGYTQKTYLIPLTFRAYNDNNQLIGSYQQVYKIDVFRLSDTYTEENSYSIRISNQAQKGLLELKTLADYANGTKASYNNGLIVSTNVPYQLSVRSIYPQFSSAEGYYLPLNVVKMQLLPAQSNTAKTNVIELSNASQIIANGPSTSKNPVYYDIEYWTNPGTPILIEAKMTEYSTTLQYEITPK